METVYCLTKEEHFELAGSCGGFSGPGVYFFADSRGTWIARTLSKSERMLAMAQHLREHYAGQTLEIRIAFKDESSGYAVFRGKAAADMATRDLFYCVHDRRDVRELKLRSANETKPLYEWRDGEALP